MIGQIEWAAFWMMLVFVPFGWLAGKGIYRLTVALIPDTLRSYPIVALLWAALLPGAAEQEVWPSEAGVEVLQEQRREVWE